MKRLLALLGACGLVAGVGGRPPRKGLAVVLVGVGIGVGSCAGGSTGNLETLPYCPKHLDVCINYIDLISNNQQEVVNAINVKTIHIPKHFEAKAELFFYSRREGKWLLQDDHTYHTGALPLPSMSRTLTPQLHSGCANGRWALEVHAFGRSSTGQAQSEWELWPGEKNAKHKILFSSLPIEKRKWPGLKVRCIA